MGFPVEDAFSYRKRHFPTEKCTFLQKMPFPAEKCTFLQKNAVFGWAEGRKLQEIAGGFLSSRVKNATQLSQEESSGISLPGLAIRSAVKFQEDPKGPSLSSGSNKREGAIH